MPDYTTVGAPFRAAYAGDCPRCGKPWAAGDKIAKLKVPVRVKMGALYDDWRLNKRRTRLAKYVHEECGE